MKKTILILALFFPISSFAITQDQAISLINVVQSSPGTPASAFTNLITAFSSITETQAKSLIGVVQAAPGVPAEAFVNLLVSFTVDVVPTQEVVDLTKKVDDLNKQITQTNQLLGQIQQNTTPPPPPSPVVVVSEPVKEIRINFFALNPTKITGGSFSDLQLIVDGATVYKSSYGGNSANVKGYLDYYIDGVRQKKFTGYWSISPDDFGSGENYPINYQCNFSFKDCGSDLGLSQDVQSSFINTGIHTFTIMIEGVTKTFSVNIQPDPNDCYNKNLEACTIIHKDYTQ